MKPSNFLLSFFFILISLTTSAATYQDGDLIFQESQSQQAKAIQEVTGSRWTHVGILFSNKGQWSVAEAVQPVSFKPLQNFIARGKNGDYRIYRTPNLTSEQRSELRKQVGKEMGKNYDIYFEWSDDLIYCSELVYKSFLKATGLEIGVVQKFYDLKLDGPYAKELILRRLQDTGRVIDLNESIVTPASQIADPKLELIESREHSY